jgi:hypothetical protein
VLLFEAAPSPAETAGTGEAAHDITPAHDLVAAGSKP